MSNIDNIQLEKANTLNGIKRVFLETGAIEGADNIVMAMQQCGVWETLSSSVKSGLMRYWYVIMKDGNITYEKAPKFGQKTAPELTKGENAAFTHLYYALCASE